MSIFTCTIKAYWREHPDQTTCHVCKKTGVTTYQCGHKTRRSKDISWWGGFHYCAECKDALPHTPPPF